MSARKVGTVSVNGATHQIEKMSTGALVCRANVCRAMGTDRTCTHVKVFKRAYALGRHLIVREMGIVFTIRLAQSAIADDPIETAAYALALRLETLTDPAAKAYAIVEFAREWGHVRTVARVKGVEKTRRIRVVDVDESGEIVKDSGDLCGI